MNFTCPFILASGSPRRKHLLEQLGTNFDIQISHADESFAPHLSPAKIVEEIAQRKVKDISKENPGALVLAADTIVVLENEVLGKPVDEEEAIHTLHRLSGNSHAVFTGLALAHEDSSRLVTSHEKTLVFFGEMTEEEIVSYVASGSPMDKAGAYGIQDDRGGLFVERIEGDFYNVVGLPLHRLYKVLKTEFEDLLS